ncbi:MULTISPECIES: alpha/beta hydrolase [Rhodomicrobium]|uniref:alpha/beta fold hydrolase n=1 Tax=Rhodomicrobium TaxID=1068 RepID=UPI000B4ACA6D|nr:MULTISPECIES: alpha/beta hydrolase [Rhodomicrobium]
MLASIIAIALSIAAIFLAALAVSAWRMARRVERALPPAGRFAEIDGARLHYVDRGEGAPVVMIHGLAANLMQFTATILDDLARTNRVIAIDRPGCGYSGRAGPDASPAAQAAILQKLLDKLGIADPLIVGHSLGGAVALAHAVLHPGKARGYALLAPAAAPQRDPPPMFRYLDVPSPIMQHLIAWTVGIPSAIKNGPAITAAVFAPQAVPKDFGMASGALLGLRPISIVTNFKDFIDARSTAGEIAGRYPEIAAPVICLFGTEDRVLPPELHLHALDRLRSAEIQVLKGAGHMLMHVEGPAVIEAIRKLDAQTAAAPRARASS